jgi:hypothetical protein
VLDHWNQIEMDLRERKRHRIPRLLCFNR